MSGRSIVNGGSDIARLVLVESKSFKISQLCRSVGLQVPGLRTSKVAEGEVLVAETRNSMFVEGTKTPTEQKRLLLVAGLSSSEEGFQDEEVVNLLSRARNIAETISIRSMNIAIPEG